jgi:hypothetical protein
MTRRSRLNPVTTIGDVVPTLAVNPASARAAIDAARSRVQITDNCYCAPPGSGTFSGTYRFFYKVGVSACDLQLVFGNWNNATASPQKDVDPTTTCTLSAAIEDANGVLFPVTFGGARQVTIGGGATAVCDPVSIEVAAGDQIWVRVFVVSGTYYNTRTYVGYSGGGGLTGTTDLTGPGSGAVADINTGVPSSGPGPMAIIGTPLLSGTPTSLILFGDSITGASNDMRVPVTGYFPTNPAIAGGGYIVRGLSGQAGLINGGITGDQIQWFNSNAGHFRRASLTRFARYAFIGYGVNDLFSGRTAAQIQQDLLTLAARCLARGVVKVIIPTLTPRASSTDRWTTVGNQTANTTNSMDTNRVTHNTWVRAGGPIDPVTLAPVAVGTAGALLFGKPGHPIGGYIEVADAVESARNSGKWAIPAATRSVNDAAATAGSQTVTSATANFTGADVGKCVNIAGAGSSGADFAQVILSVTNSTTVLLANSNAGSLPVTTVSGAQLVIGAMTNDGIHPSASVGYSTIATAVQSPLLALLT